MEITADQTQAQTTSPQESPHFSSDRGDRDGLVLPREDHFSVPRAESKLALPRYFANDSG